MAKRGPGNTDARCIQDLGDLAEGLDALNERFSPDFYIIIENVRLVDGTQRTFVADRCASVAISILWNDETANFAVVCCPFVNNPGEGDRHAAGRAVTNP